MSGRLAGRRRAISACVSRRAFARRGADDPVAIAPVELRHPVKPEDRDIVFASQIERIKR